MDSNKNNKDKENFMNEEDLENQFREILIEKSQIHYPE